MMTLNQLREQIDRLIARAAHLGNKEVKVRTPEGGLGTLESCELTADTGDCVELVIGSPAQSGGEVGNGICAQDSEEVSEAEDDLLAEDRE